MFSTAPNQETAIGALRRAGFQLSKGGSLLRDIPTRELPTQLQNIQLQAVVHVGPTLRATCSLRRGPDDELLESLLAQGPGVTCSGETSSEALARAVDEQLSRQLRWLARRGLAERAWIF